MSSHPLRTVGEFFRDTSKNHRLSFLIKVDPDALPAFPKSASTSPKDSDSDDGTAPEVRPISQELLKFINPEPSHLVRTSTRLSTSLLTPIQHCDLDALRAQIEKRTRQLVDLQSVSASLEQEFIRSLATPAQSQHFEDLTRALAGLHSQ